jgi:hypothetical protein
MESLQQLISLSASVDERMVVKAQTFHFVESMSRTEEHVRAQFVEAWLGPLVED